MIAKFRTLVPRESPPWVNALAQNLDAFVADVVTTLGGRLPVIDHRDVTFTVPAGAPPWTTGFFPLILQPTFTAKPVAVLVGRVTLAGVPQICTGLSWTLDSAGAVHITGVLGLTAGSEYTLTVVMLG